MIILLFVLLIHFYSSSTLYSGVQDIPKLTAESGYVCMLFSVCMLSSHVHFCQAALKHMFQWVVHFIKESRS